MSGGGHDAGATRVPLDEAFAPGGLVALRRMREDRAWVLTVDGLVTILTVDAELAATLHEGDDVELRAGVREGAAWWVEGVVMAVIVNPKGATVHVRARSLPERRQERRHLRIPAFDVEVSLRSQRAIPEREWFTANGFDISAGGMRFSSQRQLRVGEMVDLKVHLPSDRRPVEVDAEGVIVWGHEGGPDQVPRVPHYAVAFHDLSSATEDRIAGWVLERQTSRLRHRAPGDAGSAPT